MALRSSNPNPPSTARTSFISQPSSSSSSSNPLPNPTTTTPLPTTTPTPHHTNSTMSPELESTLATLTSHRSVLGYMLITRAAPPSIIRHSGVIFDGEQGRRYAAVVARIVEGVQAGLEEVRGEDAVGGGRGGGGGAGGAGGGGGEAQSDGDEVRFMRIRTRRHEIMISPDDRYLLAVLHDPAT